MNSGNVSSNISPDELVAWPKVAATSAMVSFSLPTFITGIETFQQMTVNDNLVSLLIASVVLTVVGGVMGSIGAITRLSSYQLVLIAFGPVGSKAVNLAFAISLLGWFGVNIDLFALALSDLLSENSRQSFPLWTVELGAAALMIGTTMVGFKGISALSSLLTPVLAVITGLMLYKAIQVQSFEAFFNIQKDASMSVSQGVGAIVGAIIIGTIILPDITRFCRTWKGGVYTAFFAYMVVQFAVLFISAFAAASFLEAEILPLLLKIGLGVMAFIVVIGGSWVLNSLNLYSTLLSIQATVDEKRNIMNNKAYAILLGAAGLLAAFFNILDFFILFLLVLSTIFIPVAGIIITDFLFLNRPLYKGGEGGDLRSSDLQSVKKAQYFPAIGAWVLGAMVASADVFEWIPTLSPISSLDSILVSGVMYFLLSILFRNS